MTLVRLFRTAGVAGIIAVAALASSVQATIVQFQTSMGDFEVNLFDEITPETVANFVSYVEDGAYTDSFLHRSVPGFVIQGGGYVYDAVEEEFKAITQREPVVNEPYLSNVRGTIAMAKVGNDPNSATSQWFFNLNDNNDPANPANLDWQNGGFTAFGQVTEEGMAILDTMAELRRVNAGGPLSHLPVRNFAQGDPIEELTLDEHHLLMIHAVVVLDAAPDTAANLSPEPSMPAPEPVAPQPRRKKSGALTGTGLGVLALLGSIAVIRRRRYLH